MGSVSDVPSGRYAQEVDGLFVGESSSSSMVAVGMVAVVVKK